jgi:N-acetylmuramoyl-L-alanine amidase
VSQPPAHPLSRRRTLAIFALAASGATVAAWQRCPDRTISGGPADPAAVDPAPVRPLLHTLDLAATGDRHPLIVAARRTKRFSLVGITWADPDAHLAACLQMRTRSAATGAWRAWSSVEVHDVHASQDSGDRRSFRGGTEPIWVGDSDGIELRPAHPTPARLPAGLRLDLVDPGHPTTTTTTASTTTAATTTTAAMVPAAFTLTPTSTATPTPTWSPVEATSTTPQPTATATPAVTATPTATATPAGPVSSQVAAATSSAPTTSTAAPTPTPTPTASTTPAPAPAPRPSAPSLVTRAGWAADEHLRRAGPLYASAVKVVFVHHTDTTNDYACGDSPAIVRGIYAYHVLSLGWNDIGYNFLVDKCGTLFEGRYGGIDQPVIGAHTYGFNTNSAGVALIGDHTTTGASAAALATLARLAAWKLGLAAITPTATSTLIEGAWDSYGFAGGHPHTFAAISGHRDGYATSCPGDGAYAQLPVLRAMATEQTRATTLVLTAITGANAVAGRYYTTGHPTLTWTTTTPATQLAGFTVLVDGRPVTATGPATRTATVTLPPGTHTLTVRADHLTTTTATDPTATATAIMVCDTTAPTFATTPTVGLRTGTVNKTGTPVALTWRATDDTLLATVAANTPTAATFSPTTTLWNTTIGPGTRTFTLTATDAAGNTRTAITAAAATWLPETAAARSGTWTVASSHNHLDGAALTCTAPNAALSWSFTAGCVAWIATRSPTSGQAKIYLDNWLVTTLDLQAAVTAYRQAVWVSNGLAPGRHLMKIVVVGTPRRPGVTTNGIVCLVGR